MDLPAFIQKHWKTFILLILLAAIYFFTRFYQLDHLPIFTDEAIYVRWAQIAKADAGMRFISLTDGKQPSFVWGAMVLMKLVSDPLMAGRLISILSGFATVVGLFFLGSTLFKNKTVGLFTSFLYIIFPMALVYDRLALYESLLGAISVWGLFLTVLFVRTLRLDVAILSGMTVGLGLLTKTSALFGLYLLPLTLILLDWKKEKKNVFRWGLLVISIVVVALAHSLLLKLSPLSYMIAEKNALFTYHLSELIAYHAFAAWPGNVVTLTTWLVEYLTFPIVLLVPISFFVDRKFFKEKVFLFLWFIIPFFLLALFGRILHPRFIFFMTLSLLPIAAYSLVHMRNFIKNPLVLVLGSLLFVILALRSDYLILTDFASAPIPQADLEQYINDWPAGGGMKEAITFIDNESLARPVVFITEGTFGSLPTTVRELYLGNNKNVLGYSLDPIPGQIPKEFLAKAKDMPVYLLLNQTQEKPSWPVVLVKKYQKGHSNSYASLYRVDSTLVKVGKTP